MKDEDRQPKAPIRTSNLPLPRLSSQRTHARTCTQRLIFAHGGHIAPVFTKPMSVQKKKKGAKEQRETGECERKHGRYANWQAPTPPLIALGVGAESRLLPKQRSTPPHNPDQPPVAPN